MKEQLLNLECVRSVLQFIQDAGRPVSIDELKSSLDFSDKEIDFTVQQLKKDSRNARNKSTPHIEMDKQVIDRLTGCGYMFLVRTEDEETWEQVKQEFSSKNNGSVWDLHHIAMRICMVNRGIHL